jgi:serine protease AprX
VRADELIAAALNGAGQPAYSVFQQGAGQTNAYNAVYSTHYACANQGLNIAKDLAGTRHYMGPARQNASGRFYVVDQNNNPLSGQGYLWSNGYLWPNGYLWSQGATPPVSSAAARAMSAAEAGRS